MVVIVVVIEQRYPVKIRVVDFDVARAEVRDVQVEVALVFGDCSALVNCSVCGRRISGIVYFQCRGGPACPR
jgi:hypothetical protein